LNGDTMFKVDLQVLLAYHKSTGAATTLALKHLHNFSRYGTVQVAQDGRITRFEEKKECVEGWINGGIYVIDKAALSAKNLPQKYSFEKDYLEAFVGEGKIYGQKADGYFIDIGIPEDYAQAQTDFKELFK
jgi:D-glycero-alpha-D-manno-heptose 1-phosphate guanylyltransferase